MMDRKRNADASTSGRCASVIRDNPSFFGTDGVIRAPATLVEPHGVGHRVRCGPASRCVRDRPWL